MSTRISEMLKFQFGKKVRCVDGEAGSLEHVVFDAEARRLIHIGVKRSLLFGKTVDLPYETVSQATGEGIALYLTLAEFAAVKERAPQEAVLDRKSLVIRASAGDRGTLLQVAVHPENAVLAYLVVHHLRPGQDILLKEQYITTLAPQRVIVTLSDAVLKALPPYRPDNELEQEVKQVLFDLSPLHIDLRRVVVRVIDSVLYLDGNVANRLRANLVEDQVLGVVGLLEIKNRLVGDDQLAATLAMLLARDPRTRGLPIGIYPHLGDVRLSGAVHTHQQKIAAENDVWGYPGVRSVINNLVIDPKAELLPALLPTGVETDDPVPGKYVRHTK